MDAALLDFEVSAVRARHVTRLIRTVEDFAAPSGTSANSCDRRRYAFGHVICADADALQALPPSNGWQIFRNHINFHHTYYSKDHLV